MKQARMKQTPHGHRPAAVSRTHLWSALLLIAVACGPSESPDIAAPVIGHAGQALSQGPVRMVKKIRTVPASPDPTSNSNPANFTQVGSTLFFTATDKTTGNELWKTDGTPEGTQLVKDIFPHWSSSSPAFLTNVNGTLFFAAADGSNGIELWKSDGTTAGTVLIKALNSNGNSAFGTFVAMGNLLLFTLTLQGYGTELWRSDGTSDGTFILKDIFPGTGSSNPTSITAVGNQAFFVANDGAVGNELWRTDGSSVGTVLVSDIYAGSTGSSPALLTEMNGSLFYRATTASNGAELWMTNIATSTTQMVRDIWVGSNGSSISSLTKLNDTLYFTANDASTGQELWKYTAAGGVVRVKDIYTGFTGSSPAQMNNLNGSLLFTASGSSGEGIELWKSDGTTGGTVLVKDINPGATSSSPDTFTQVGNTFFFLATESTTGRELWRTDGTTAGTTLVKDIVAGTGSSTFSGFKELNGALYFVADDGVNGSELWRSDGTPSGTVLLKEINSGSGSAAPTSLTAFNGQILFAANDGINGVELWATDGTSDGTRMLKEIGLVQVSSSVVSLTPLNGLLYFGASDGIAGRELWKTDGTEAGTVLVKEINPSTTGGFIGPALNVNGTIYFVGNDGVGGSELWKSDGTAAGTVLVKDIFPGSANSNPNNFIEVNGALFFVATDAHGPELWRSDGTAAGTVLVKDITPGTDGTQPPSNFAVVDKRLFFSASTPTYGRELWVSDGTAAGTVQVADIYPGVNSGGLRFPTEMSGSLFFSATDGMTGTELWRTDSSSLNTTLVADIEAGGGSSGPFNLINVNGTLFFAAGTNALGSGLWKWNGSASFIKSSYPKDDILSDSIEPLLDLNGILLFSSADPLNGQELWRSDGTPGGTFLIKDINPGVSHSSPLLAIKVGAVAVFQATDGSHGNELWKSAGTTASTQLVADVNEGAHPSFPSNFALVGSNLYFTAEDELGGLELYVVPATAIDTPPSVTCPAGLTLEAVSPAGSTATYQATASDLESVVTPTLSLASGSVFPIGTTAVVASTQDALGTTASCSFNVTVQDTTAPSLTCPANVTRYVSSSAEGATVEFQATATDAVTASPTVTYSNASGSQFPVGATTVTVTATDAAHNVTYCQFSVTIIRDLPPVLSCPANRAVEAAGPTGASVTWPAATVTDDRTAIPTLTYSRSSGSTFPLGATPVTVTARDSMENVSTCTFFVTVQDTTAPTITCPANITVDAINASGAPVPFANALATDTVDAAPTVTSSTPSTTTFPLGTTSVVMTARDGAGNTASCTFSIVVRDTQAPDLSCPVSLVVEATAPGGNVVTYFPAAVSDNVTAQPEVTYSTASGSLFSVGMHHLTVAATDTSHNSSTCQFDILVQDTTPPTVSCPSSVAAEATSPTGALATYGSAVAADVVTPSPTVTFSQARGTKFPLGITTVTATAVDGSGNSTTCTFTVTVRDEVAPVVTCPAAVSVEATSPSGAAATFKAATAVDVVTASPVLTYSNASGSTFPVGTTIVTATAKDAAQNTSTCTFNVVVVDTTPPKASCPADLTAAASSASGATVVYPALSATDLASPTPTVEASPPSGALFPLGTSTVTVRATDDAGLVDTCTFKVTVRDVTPPVVTCPPAIVLEATSGAGAIATFQPTASDAITAAPTLSASHASGAVFPIGLTTVTIEATDEAQNRATCTFDIHVQDTTAPVLSCPEQVVEEATSALATSVAFAATATDLVTPSLALTYSQDPSTAFALGTTQVTASTIDAAGNSASCTFLVTVVDTTPPGIAPVNNVTAEATSPEGAPVVFVAPRVSDAVSTPTVTPSIESGAVFPLGPTTVTWTAIDAVGNAATTAFVVTVRDTTPPQITCPNRIEVQASTQQGATVPFGRPTATDLVTPKITPALSHESGSLFPVGETTVTATATDAASNQATCTFVVAVTAPAPDSTPAPPMRKVKTGCTSADAIPGALLLLPLARRWRRGARSKANRSSVR